LTAETTHQDKVFLADEQEEEKEMWLIDSGATANVTASNADAKNVMRSKRQVKRLEMARCVTRQEREK
jgi:hypothetical protein